MDGVVTHGRVLALVPARGGSKSIPRKNLRRLGGAPLICYSISAGLSARLVDRVVVSTDDDEIAAVARERGAEVPFIRPAALAEDTTPDLPVFQHALAWLREHEGWVPEIVVQLRPTSPLRPPNCIDLAVERLHSDPGADSVRGVVLASQNPYKMWRQRDDGSLAPLLTADGPEPFNQPRQSLPLSYWQTGHVDAVRTATIVGKGSMSGDRILPLVVESAYSCDIDTEQDWERAEETLARFDRPLVRPRGAAGLPDDPGLVVFDFDGVMTDNRVWVTEQGEEAVACSRGDGMGLQQLRRLGVEAFVLSTERNPVVGRRCEKLRLPFEQGVADKGARLREIITERGLDPARVVYVGNDVNDLECLAIAGCGVAVADSHPEVLRAADLVLTRAGGFGAVRELCDRIAALRRGR